MSREKQIEKMASVIKLSLDSLGCGNFIFTGEEISTMFAEALYNAGYRKQEWISVDEALPEDQQMVLTIDTEGEMQVCFYETEWKGIFHMCHGLVKIFNITHWMPLPEAPKMKGGAE